MPTVVYFSAAHFFAETDGHPFDALPLATGQTTYN